MKHIFTSTIRSLYTLVFVLSFVYGNTSIAQTNVALTATAVNGPGGGSGTCIPTPNLYGPCLYNNGIIPTYNTGGSGGAWSFTWTSTNNGVDSWVKFYWTPGNIPPANSISKMVFYKDNRPMIKADIKYWNSLTSSWVNHATYLNYNNVIADSINFPAIPISTDTIMIANINAGSQSSVTTNPNFREIQIWSMTSCTGTPSTSIQAKYNGSIVNSPVTNVCVGNIVSLSATSNNVSSGHAYQWQRGTSSTGPWTSISGATQPGIDVQAFGSYFYRVIDTCVNSASYAASSSVEVTSALQSLATLSPDYFQSFESWLTSCATGQYLRDIPTANWSNSPPSGLKTWRIDSITTVYTSGWNTATVGTYSPTSWPSTFPTSRSARSHTAGLPPGSTSNLDLHMDLSTPIGGKAMYFYMINQVGSAPVGTDSLKILLSIDSGATWSQLASWDTAAAWRRRIVPINTNSNNAIIRFQGYKSTDIALNESSDIGVDSVYIVGPCSGMPSAGFINLTSPVIACPGTVINLTPNGTTMAGGLVYTWEQSTNLATWSNAVGGSGYSNFSFTTPTLNDTIAYRLKVTCGSNIAYTNTIQFNVPQPQYASIPFSENFESWMTRCINTSVCPSCSLESPSDYWVNFPTVGNNSWRRQDQGALANWTSNTNGSISGNAPQGGYYARFHSNQVSNGITGNLDLFLNCSTVVGNKELQFLYNNVTGTDSLRVWLSTNGGGNFTKITTIGANPNGWANQIVPIASNSSTTVIRLVGSSDVNGSDIAIDQLVVLPPCNGSPNPGIISSASPCPGTAFTVSLLNLSLVANLNFQWEESTSATGPWTQISGATSTSYSTNTVFSNVYYRVRAICLNTNDTSYTPVKLIPIANFYYCYCNSNAISNIGADIGNFNVMWVYTPPLPGSPVPVSVVTNVGTATPLTNNTNAIGTYTDNRYPTTPLIPLYHDSTYQFSVTQINSGNFLSSTCSIWLDKNRDGIFGTGERIFKKNTSQSSNPSEEVDTMYYVPDSLPIGITGLRVVLENPINNSSLVCGQFNAGETEDYLVEIRYPPCDGPTNAGGAYTRDTLGCPGYVMTFGDTTHEHKRHNISWLWEYSPDGNSWAVVPGSQMHDSITLTINGPTYARLRMICVKDFIIDTTYSNAIKISINPPYACYCYSLADGGTMDTSDIGSFVLGSYVFANNPPGPHLLNGEAIQMRTDNTKDTIVLWTNTTYPFMFYHIMKSPTHADAKITMFMDFNNDLLYNITPSYNERIYTGYTNANNYLINGFITIPPYAVPNIRTGMRIILNNDTSPNVQSDSACGAYFSGETEDYVVIFKNQTSVETLGNINQFYVFPNPTEGVFSVSFNALKPVSNATVSVFNLMGIKVTEKQFTQAGKEFSHNFDLSGFSKGVYLVELKADEERIVKRIVVK